MKKGSSARAIPAGPNNRLRKRTKFVFTVTCGLALIAPCRWMIGQTPAHAANPDADDKSDAQTMKQLIDLRDSFVKRIATEGFSCPIAPPKILLQHVPSFGNYDPETNSLQTPAWRQLSDEEKGLFHHLAGPESDEAAAQRIFEVGSHHWVFVHEMGHWWQACNDANRNRQHYQVEYGANRIAAAYWREVDSQLLAEFDLSFKNFLKDAPNPVPDGQSPERYFNENYEELGKSPSYGWFQSLMIAQVNAEKPLPTFAEALAQVKK